MRIGELLIRRQLITPEQLATALEAQKRDGARVGSRLVELGFLDPDVLARALSEQHRVPAVLRRHFASCDRRACERIPAQIAGQYGIVPLGFSTAQPTRLICACVDPAIAPVDELSFCAGMRVDLGIAPEVLIRSALEQLYGVRRVDDRFVDIDVHKIEVPSSIPPGPVSDMWQQFQPPSAPTTPRNLPNPRGAAAAKGARATVTSGRPSSAGMQAASPRAASSQQIAAAPVSTDSPWTNPPEVRKTNSSGSTPAVNAKVVPPRTSQTELPALTPTGSTPHRHSVPPDSLASISEPFASSRRGSKRPELEPPAGVEAPRPASERGARTLGSLPPAPMPKAPSDEEPTAQYPLLTSLADGADARGFARALESDLSEESDDLPEDDDEALAAVEFARAQRAALAALSLDTPETSELDPDAVMSSEHDSGVQPKARRTTLEMGVTSLESASEPVPSPVDRGGPRRATLQMGVVEEQPLSLRPAFLRPTGGSAGATQAAAQQLVDVGVADVASPTSTRVVVPGSVPSDSVPPLPLSAVPTPRDPGAPSGTLDVPPVSRRTAQMNAVLAAQSSAGGTSRAANASSDPPLQSIEEGWPAPDADVEPGESESAVIAADEASPGPDRSALTVDFAVELIAKAENRDAVGDLIGRYLKSFGDYALVLIVKGDVALGWRGHAANVDQDVVESISVPLTTPSMMKLAVDTMAPFVGPPPEAGASIQSRLWKLLRCDAPREVMVAPVVVKSRVVNLLYVQGRGDGTIPEEARAEVLRVAAAAADRYVAFIRSK